VKTPADAAAREPIGTDELIVEDDLPLALRDQAAGLLTHMLVTRALDREFVNLQRQGQLGLYPSCHGQEAAQVGTAAALRSDDMVFPQYRELGVFVLRGVDPVGLGHMWRGTVHGGLDLIEHCCAPLTIPIATHALHAVGWAMGAQRDHDGRVAVAYLGDGATSEGDFHEALNFAGVFDAPCVFVIQNNHWAISVPVSEQTRSATLAEKAAAYGIPGVRCDGNDLVACWRAMHAAVQRARAGRGPSVIEAVTYRIEAHTTSDEPRRYRDDAEVDAWRARDPIPRFRRELETRDLWDDEQGQAADARARTAVARLRAALFDAPDPEPLGMFDHVFSEPTPTMLEQRAMLEAEQEPRG